MTADQKLAKLESLLKIVDEAVTHDEFLKAFEGVLKYVKTIKERNDVVISRVEKGYEDTTFAARKDIAALKGELTESFAALKKRLSDEHRARMAGVDSKIAELRNGKDGKNGNPGRDGKDADPAKVKKMVLQDLKRELDDLVSAVEKRLDDKMQTLSLRPTTQIFGPGKTRIIKVDLSSQLDGVTKTFSIGFSHFGIISVQSDSAPFGAFRESVDYNEVGRTIVFTDAIDAAISLAAGHSLILKVLK